MSGQAVESVSGAGAPSQSSTPHRGGALLQCLPGNYAQAMTRQARRPASERTLDPGAGSGTAARPPRPATQLRLPSRGPRREPSHDRKAPWPHPSADYRPIRTSRPRHGKGVGVARRQQHRGGTRFSRALDQDTQFGNRWCHLPPPRQARPHGVSDDRHRKLPTVLGTEPLRAHNGRDWNPGTYMW